MPFERDAVRCGRVASTASQPSIELLEGKLALRRFLGMGTIA